VNEPLDTWFKREILREEAALMRYLRRLWPRPVEVDDLRQETYARVYESARTHRPEAARAFLFATARNLVIDRVRRERIVSIEAVPDIESEFVLIDELSPERRTIARQELKRLAQAFDWLPERCREVVWLRRVLELSQRQVAARLGISERTVEKHVAKGGRLLARYMFGEDAAAMPAQRRAGRADAAEDDERERKDP
jgi:RNA polymerase sigma factor (sigma-70 family)